MKRAATLASQIAIDLAALSLAFAIAFFARFDGDPPIDMIGRIFLTMPYVVLGEYALLAMFGVPRFAWRYTGLREIGTILAATLASAVVLALVRVALGELQFDTPVLRHGVVPYGVLAFNAVLAFLAVGGVRAVRRIIGERVDRGRRSLRAPTTETVPTMLIGAGQAGVMMARELRSRPELGLRAVGFLDDDAAKHGSLIHGVRVLGSVADLERLCSEHDARQVLVTIANAPGSAIRGIFGAAERAGVPVKIIPGLFELAGGAVNISRIRDVAIEDLLGRDTVELDMDSIAAIVDGRTVMVTGAGGSIGSELCRQLCRFAPARLLLVEQAENALFEIHRELLRKHGDRELVPLIADVTDERRMTSLFERHRPAVVLHAAAHKHVPMMEWNPGEALKNNVLGTALVADLAHRFEAERFVMISTDKAVNPTSVMGATKRIAEMYVQSLAAGSKTRFATVRFGNVLGSAGSVIPIFREQIASGGPVTVTHPDMRRYFMTIPEACQLVLQASTLGDGGEIFVLDMGEPVKIVDLARDLIRLSGFKPDEDIQIAFSGVRPGEKLFEEIATDAEQADKTKHPKIFVGKTRGPDKTMVAGWLGRIPTLAARGDVDEIVAFVRDCVPEMVGAVAEEPASTSVTPPSANDATGERPRARRSTPGVDLVTSAR